MKRKRLTRRQVLEHWEASGGICWRCEQKIEHEVYGEGWHLGHVDKPHWLGGIKVAPEHASCNMEDAKVQTRAAAKSVRIRARNAGIKQPSRFREMREWMKGRPKRPHKCVECGMYAADAPSKLCPDCEAYLEHQHG